MISGIIGKVTNLEGQRADILSGSLIFSVFLPNLVAQEIKVGEKKTFYTYLSLSDKGVELFGFINPEDVATFRLLLTVSGVGPKMALRIFDSQKGEKIQAAIDRADVDFFTQIKGLGKKTAQRIVVDLKAVFERKKEEEEKTFWEKESLLANALAQLGFDKREVKEVLVSLPAGLGTDEEKVAWALNFLSKNKHGEQTG
ncbi:Holliday junction branch migration protein RuvA [Candidatus Shapirobacteria bacterium]|nr:Holliday junction branch migration protein RuvA [Candidatus Shapirobacteria bacterium]